MTELQKRDDNIINNADKGGAITILDSDEYINEANRQLINEQCNQKLSSNPILNHSNTVNDTIDLFKIEQMIPEKVAEGIKVNKPKTPTLKLRDTKHFLNELDKVPASESNDSYLVTLDIWSLYSNILNEGVNVIKNLLQRNQSKVTKVITAFLWLILTLNNFIFNATNYLQLSWEPNVQ